MFEIPGGRGDGYGGSEDESWTGLCLRLLLVGWIDTTTEQLRKQTQMPPWRRQLKTGSRVGRLPGKE